MSKVLVVAFLSAITLMNATNAWARPEVERSGMEFVTVGGGFDEAQSIVIEQCQSLSPFFKFVSFKKDHFSIVGRHRYFSCGFLKDASERVRPPSVQQRVLQSRKILKPVGDVVIGVSNWAKDEGGAAAVVKHKISNNTSIPEEIIGSIYYRNARWGLRFYLDVQARDDSSTILRLRTFEMRDEFQNHDELFSPGIYQMIFDGIARQLFVDAIALEPIEIN